MQLYWLNKQYNLEEKEFTTNVVKSIKAFYVDVNYNTQKNLQTLIELPDKNTFLFKVDSAISATTLEDSIALELSTQNVFTDCKVALYHPQQNAYVYEVYMPTAASHYPINEGKELPIFKRNYTYGMLNFPHRNKYILGQMSWWIFSSIVLILVLVCFAISLFYLYKQKFQNEIQNDFIRNVTHEFQTPLTTLTVGLDIIAKPTIVDHPEKLAKYTKLMQGQTEYLKQHIDNLMKVLKTEAVGLVLEKKEVQPHQLIKNAIAQLYTVIDEKNATIQYFFEPTETTILADYNNLFVAILNLISNAIKYASKPVVIIETRVQNNVYSISIKDNGIGIDKHFQKKLFKKFYRVPTGDVHNVKGLGLGLYFVKKVIDAHGGNIKLNSIVGIGTEFVIELPKN